MKSSDFSFKESYFLMKFLSRLLIHVWAFVVTVTSLSWGRKIFFGIGAAVAVFLLTSHVGPYALVFFNKIFGNPEMTAYNQCVFNVIEEAPLDEEFSWRLIACGEAPSRFKSLF